MFFMSSKDVQIFIVSSCFMNPQQGHSFVFSLSWIEICLPRRFSVCCSSGYLFAKDRSYLISWLRCGELRVQYLDSSDTPRESWWFPPCLYYLLYLRVTQVHLLEKNWKLCQWVWCWTSSAFPLSDCWAHSMLHPRASERFSFKYDYKIKLLSEYFIVHGLPNFLSYYRFNISRGCYSNSYPRDVYAGYYFVVSNILLGLYVTHKHIKCLITIECQTSPQVFCDQCSATNTRWSLFYRFPSPYDCRGYLRIDWRVLRAENQT
jgi:hypothetical protein